MVHLADVEDGRAPMRESKTLFLKNKREWVKERRKQMDRPIAS